MKAQLLTGLALGALLPGAAAAQDGNVNVPQSLLDEVNAIFPERNNSGAQFLSDEYSPNFEVVDPTEVEITFIWEGAGYRNTLGYFTYTENGNGNVNIVSSNLIIPNASFPNAGTIASGDTFMLRDESGNVRTFQTGEKVGFFLIADGWRTEDSVQDWDASAVEIPSKNPKKNQCQPARQF